MIPFLVVLLGTYAEPPPTAEIILEELLEVIARFPAEHGRAMSRDELRAAASERPALARADPDVLRDRQTAIVAAWEATRPAPPIAPTDLARIFRCKRNALATLDATMLVQVAAWPDRAPAGFIAPDATDRAQAHWVRSAFDMDRRFLAVAPAAHDMTDMIEGTDGAAALIPARADWTHGVVRVFDGTQEGVLDRHRKTGWIGVPESLDAYVDRFEPWPAAGGLIGDHARGTARARESDLGALLANADLGLATVAADPELVDDHSCLVLRYGWGDPLTIWIDPAFGYAPRRLTERLAFDDVAVLVSVHFDDLVDTGHGIWLPRRIVRTQACVSEDDVAAPFLVIETRVCAFTVHGAVRGDLFDPRTIFPEGTTVVERHSGAVRTAPLQEIEP